MLYVFSELRIAACVPCEACSAMLYSSSPFFFLLCARYRHSWTPINCFLVSRRAVYKLAGHLRWGCRCGKRPRGVEAPQTPSSAPMPRVVHRPPSAPAPRVPCCSARCVAVAIPMPSACFLLSEEYQNLREQSALNVPLTSIAASSSGEISLTDKVAAHARCSLSNQNDCSRCAGALFASAGSSE